MATAVLAAHPGQIWRDDCYYLDRKSLRAAEELPDHGLAPALDDRLVALVEGVLEVKHRDHQPDRQALTARRARARAGHRQGGAEHVHLFHRPALAILVGKGRRQRRFDLRSRHPRSQLGQRLLCGLRGASAPRCQSQRAESGALGSAGIAGPPHGQFRPAQGAHQVAHPAR